VSCDYQAVTNPLLQLRKSLITVMMNNSYLVCCVPVCSLFFMSRVLKLYQRLSLDFSLVNIVQPSKMLNISFSRVIFFVSAKVSGFW
jgi:hypothetical protein